MKMHYEGEVKKTEEGYTVKANWQGGPEVQGESLSEAKQKFRDACERKGVQRFSFTTQPMG
jgi:hypothetical protein